MEGVVALFIPIVAVISIFTFLTVIIVIGSKNRLREREKLYEVAKAAIDQGQPLPPELISALADVQKAKRTAFSDLRAGVITLASGAGFALFGGFIGYNEPDALLPLVGIGAIPALVGIALIVLSRFNPNQDSRN